MYAAHFGLSQDPFSIAPDPRYLYMSARHRAALAHLLYGVNGGGGFVLLSGEIGTGKTTVCRCFLEQIPAGCHVAYIFNPKLTVTELLKTICDEFRIAVAPTAVTAKDFIDPLNAFLLDNHAQGRSSVLIIDEAQNLSADVLEQLRLLTNLETSQRKLLQIVLIGQPELRDMLARPDLEQLAQRVIARFHLGPMTEAETAHYIAHRMGVAGHTGALPFDARALHRIHQLSRGVPRRVNLLCDRALLGAYATGQAMVDQTIAEKAAGEVFGRDIPTLTQVVTAPSRQGLALRIALAAGLLLAGAALAVGVLRWMEPAPSPAAALPAAMSSVPAKPSATAGVVHDGELSLKPATGVTLPAPTKP